MLDTDAEDRAMTSASLVQLNEILTKNAARQRRIYLLDACFAAASLRDIMGAGEDALEEKVGAIIAPWPESGRGDRGVAALCSADRSSTASAGGERQLTQFTDGLLSVLETGDTSLGEALSLRQTHQLLRTVLRHLLLSATVSTELTLTRLADEERHVNDLETDWLELKEVQRTKPATEGSREPLRKPNMR